MFTGEYRHTVDSKGRVSLPATFRKSLPEHIVVCKGFDESLFVFAPEEYESWLSSLVEYDDLDEDIRAFYRVLTAGAMRVDVDSAGRVGISQYLRDYAHLEKDVVVSGNRSRLEIWDSARWDAYTARYGAIDDLVKKVRPKKAE